jgi:hypothetical protein
MKAFEVKHLQRHQFHGDWNSRVTAIPVDNPTHPGDPEKFFSGP